MKAASLFPGTGRLKVWMKIQALERSTPSLSTKAVIGCFAVIGTWPLCSPFLHLAKENTNFEFL